MVDLLTRELKMSTSVLAPSKRPEIKTALPGPKGQKIVEADAKFVTPSYPRPSFKLVAERGSGVWVEDVDGNVFWTATPASPSVPPATAIPK